MKSFLILFFIGAHSLFNSPGDPISSIRKALAKYYRNYPREKVYLLCDKQSYSSSETIWFSGYVTCYSKPSAISHTLYTELFNEAGLVIDRGMLPVSNGFVVGNFLLPANLPEGNYYIRAYTAWMLNFDASLFFYRKISVVDDRKNNKSNLASTRNDFSIQFYPESGHLISRLNSLIAFKAVDVNGLPVMVEGKVFNSLGDTVAFIKTIHDGMGSFVIHCTPQTTYTALVTANGVTKKVLLPTAQTGGVVLHTEVRNVGVEDSVFFHISRTGIDKEKYENLILCAQMGTQFSVSRIHFSEEAFNDPFDTVLNASYPLLINNFGTGVLRLSVLNEDKELLAERMLFLHKQEIENVEWKIVANETNTSANISMVIPQHYRGTIAVSVTDASNESDYADNASLNSSLLLCADLEASVNNPDFYFGRSNHVDKALDLLMLTSKYAESNVQNILRGQEQPIKYAPEKSLQLSGRAFKMSAEKNTPLTNGSLFLMLKARTDSISIPLVISTDSAGLFTSPDLNFHDTAIIYIQTNAKATDQLPGNINIEFFKNIFDSIAGKRYVIPPSMPEPNSFKQNAEPTESKYNIADEKAMLTNVTVTAKAKTHLDSIIAKYATGFFASPGAWAQTIDLTNDPITINADQGVLEWLNGKAPGLNYAYDKGKPVIYWRFSNIIAGLSAMDQLKLNAPAFFLNERLLNTGLEGYDGAIDLLAGIRVADVALIRIYKPGTMPNVPDNGPHGTVAIYLKNGTEQNKSIAKITFDKSTKLGYRKVMPFRKTNEASGVSSTLYWNPALSIDTVAHIASFNINGVLPKKIRIIAEGLDEDGHMIRLNQLIKSDAH